MQINSADGVVGLNNLGNTCYMNSALQCLSNLACFRQYLLSMAFGKEINKDNPLGTGGEVVTQLASLYYSMWNKACAFGYVNPSTFKKVFCDHSIMFQGYDQHDSAEFLA